MFGSLEHFERTRFKQSIVQPESAISEMQQLHPVVTSINKNEHAPVGWIRAELFSHDRRQTAESFSHIDDAGVNEDPGVAMYIQHHKAPETLLTRNCVAALLTLVLTHIQVVILCPFGNCA